MLARFFLLLLLLNLAMPFGVLGKVTHLCSLPGAKQLDCSCAKIPDTHAESESHTANRACCKVAVPRQVQPSHPPISSASQSPIPIVADIPLTPLPTPSELAWSGSRFPHKQADRPGRGALIFLLCCSFLI